MSLKWKTLLPLPSSKSGNVQQSNHQGGTAHVVEQQAQKVLLKKALHMFILK